MLPWLLLCGFLAVTLAQGPAPGSNANPVEQVEAVWVPVGLQVTDLSLLYTAAEKPADEPAPPDFNSSLVSLDECSSSMNLLVSLPKFLQAELSRALDNETKFADTLGLKVNITGNFTGNSTQNSTLSPENWGGEWPAEDMTSSPLADEALDDAVRNVFNDEASNKLLQELAPSLQGLNDEVLQRSFDTVRRMRTHFGSRCRYDCIQGFCGYIIIDCTEYGLPCRWRRCRGTCVQCQYRADVCIRRPNMLYENRRYACDVDLVRPNLFRNPRLGSRCGC